MKPFLRVCTSDHYLFCGVERSEESRQYSQVQQDVSRSIIKRAFAFDEWDDAEHETSEAETTDDDEVELLNSIHRSDAFDEWDNDERVGFWGEDNHETRVPFVPIPDECRHVRTIKTTLAQPFGTFQTKFDLDADDSQPATVTPSPPKATIERPIPLYSQQPHHLPRNLFSTTPKLDYPAACLEGMLRASFEPSFPMVCESIPRMASAFSIPTTTNIQPRSWDDDEKSHWFDKYGSGTTLFEDDDYSFESPTSTLDEDSLFATSIPKFIVCYHTNE